MRFQDTADTYAAMIETDPALLNQPLALVPWTERQPFALSGDTHRRLSAAHSRLATPSRVQWWFDMGVEDGATARRYGAPKSGGPETRAYRIGWVKGARA